MAGQDKGRSTTIEHPEVQNMIRRAKKARQKAKGGRNPRTTGANLLNAMAGGYIGHHDRPGYTSRSGATPQAIKAMHHIASR